MKVRTIFESSLFIILVLSTLVIFGKIVADADDKCRAANETYSDYRFCLGI